MRTLVVALAWQLPALAASGSPEIYLDNLRWEVTEEV